MSEHKFKVGDLVREKNFTSKALVVTETTSDAEIVYATEEDDVFKRTYSLFAKNLELMATADEIAEMFTEANEKEKKEHTLPNPADLTSKEEIDKLLSSVPIQREDAERLLKADKDVNLNSPTIIQDLFEAAEEPETEEDKQINEAINALIDAGYTADESSLMDEDTQRFIDKIEEKAKERIKGCQIDADKQINKMPEGSDVQFYRAVYKNGYQTGYDMGFHCGQNNAWEIVEKLFDTPIDDINEIFGVTYEADVIKQYSPLEVKKKLEQYHKDQEVKALQKTLLDAFTTYGKDKIIEFLDQIEEES